MFLCIVWDTSCVLSRTISMRNLWRSKSHELIQHLQNSFEQQIKEINLQNFKLSMLWSHAEFWLEQTKESAKIKKLLNQCNLMDVNLNYYINNILFKPLERGTEFVITDLMSHYAYIFQGWFPFYSRRSVVIALDDL